MTEKEKAEYLKNELRSYNVMKKWIENDDQEISKRIDYYNLKIAEYDAMLNEGNSKSIEFGHVPTTAVGEPLTTILYQQEVLIKRRDELISIRDQDVYGFKARVKHIEECFERLDDDMEREFIRRYYCNGESIDHILTGFARSRSRLFADREKIIKKML